MGKNKLLILFIGIIAVIFFFLILPWITRLPATQASLYRFYYKITNTEDNPQKIAELHSIAEARKKGKKEYDYGREDRKIKLADSAKCIACHGSMVERGKDAKSPNRIHKTKFTRLKFLKFTCTDCHRDVDLSKRQPGKATMKVYRKFCHGCHGAAATAKPTVKEQARASTSVKSLPSLIKQHGTDEESGKKWTTDHSRVVVAVGIDACRKCHIQGSELDICNDCHQRGGMRPASHRVLYNIPFKKIYPESSKTGKASARWLGFHFVPVREALQKMGVKNVAPQNLPLDKIKSGLTCNMCHVIEEWCTKCHIQHGKGWLRSPDAGHGSIVNKSGASGCYNCHDSNETKCSSCH